MSFFTVLQLQSSHHWNVDAVGGGHGDEGHQPTDERRQRLDERVQAEGRHESSSGRGHVRCSCALLLHYKN